MQKSQRLPPASVALPERAAAARHFDAVCETFDAACAAHDHARAILLGRLKWFKLEPRIVLDAGCGTGRGIDELARHYPRAHVVGLDRSPGMMAVAGRRSGRSALLRADIESLPFASHSVDLVFANLALPWCDPQRLLAEIARVLTPAGLLLASTTGPATLEQVRKAWRAVDDRVHVHASLDVQTLGDLLARAGLRQPVLDTDRVTLRYSGIASLHEELRAVGASNAAGGRRRTLTGKSRFAAYERELLAASGGRSLDVSVEFHFLQAWGPLDLPPRAAAPRSFRGIAVRRE